MIRQVDLVRVDDGWSLQLADHSSQEQLIDVKEVHGEQSVSESPDLNFL